MPQEFQVLLCFKCRTFQVHQVKKSTRWDCKLCGEKQSVKRNYGIGTGKECRLHVQKLNSLRAECDQVKNTYDANEYDVSENSMALPISDLVPTNSNITQNKSKWSQFVEDIKENASKENCVNRDDLSELFIDKPPKKRRLNAKAAISNELAENCYISPVSSNHIKGIVKNEADVEENYSSLDDLSQNEHESLEYSNTKKYLYESPKKSKWSKFIDNEAEDVKLNNSESKNNIDFIKNVSDESTGYRLNQSRTDKIDHKKSTTASINMFSLAYEDELDDILNI